jgi:2-polyprenyl-3-methyl-5-hydroxy-6-metoxy-1,4-benzoquinol methylase
VDRRPGDGVDVVCDGVKYEPVELVDLVICAEVLEHAENAEALVAHIVDCIAPGGHLIVTCATTGRAPHSGIDGGSVREGEHYANISAADLTAWLESAGAEVVEAGVHMGLGDLYMLAVVR